ncbi:penicillin-binding protein activator [Catenovulum sp. SM1970]|uniref:penicillin-binding protein activator n=1 Tax=Marinifaba aquimaris TaxID=2741323 RepID=UPI0015729DC3|nr:penicillin-binding protein activator [Marinifaba aquimaris]NTS76606.1 penicillin-binding protein activator [Marinifaba aquimaris]
MSQVKYLSIVALLLASLVACTSTPKNQAKVEKATTTKTDKQARQPKTAADYLARAEIATSEQQAAIWYTRASDELLKTGRAIEAHALLSQISPALLTDFMRQQYQLFMAESLLLLGDDQLSYQIAKELKPINQFESRVLLVKADSAAASQHDLAAARARIAMIESGLFQSEQGIFNQQIWHHVNQLQDVSLTNFVSNKEPTLSGWLQLVKISRDFADQSELMLNKIKQWQQTYPEHAAAQSLPDDLYQALNTEQYPVNQVMAVLPLTGKFAKQGKAVQQGILAASLDSDVIVQFIDSQNYDFTQPTPENIDFVIGPLLKENLSNFAQYFAGIPALHLNQIDELTLTPSHYSFALTPESEAIQAATMLAEQGYRAPAIIAANNSFGHRISQTFKQTFEQKTNNKAHLAYFNSADDMKNVVEQVLGTKSSRTHIKTMKTLFNNAKKFESEVRNKQDIDMIYLVGDPTQTKLLKPFIDINTASYTKPAPIYATSRSYTNNIDMLDFNDLANITFSQIPWLLPGDSKEQALAQEMRQVWPNSQFATLSLFAFGYDAFSLLPNLARMKAFSGFYQSGLSGELSVNRSGQVERKLAWGQFKANKIIRRDTIH